MKYLTSAILFLIFNLSFAQIETTRTDIPLKKSFRFSQFEISVPLQGNKDRGEDFSRKKF